MPAYVALLRGVNVGKARRVPMADFRQLLGNLGYRDVATLQGIAPLGKLGRAATTRNWATTLKLKALACGDRE